MSLQTEIQTRKEILKTRLANINESLVDKGVNPVRNLAEVPAAIDSIKAGGVDESFETTFIEDGDTHIWIRLEEGHTSPCLGLGVNGTVTIDWGDGSEPEELSGTSINTFVATSPHEYSGAGDYMITITIAGTSRIAFHAGIFSKLLFEIDTVNEADAPCYRHAIRKLECGTNITAFINYSMADCRNLRSVKLSNNTAIRDYVFLGCTSLRYIEKHDECTTFGTSAFSGCTSLKGVDIKEGVSYISTEYFNECISLENITIPDSVNTIYDKVFYDCHSLKAIKIPASITSLRNEAFRRCYSLKSIEFPENLTAINYGMARECYCLESVRLPSKVTSIGNDAFSSCFSLKEVELPESLNSLGTTTFKDCRSLSHINIPGGVSIISNNVFAGCTSMEYYDFTRHAAVPTLSSTNAFTAIPSDCEIRVPMALVDEWKAATNWSTYADQIVGV